MQSSAIKSKLVHILITRIQLSWAMQLNTCLDSHMKSHRQYLLEKYAPHESNLCDVVNGQSVPVGIAEQNLPAATTSIGGHPPPITGPVTIKSQSPASPNDLKPMGESSRIISSNE